MTELYEIGLSLVLFSFIILIIAIILYFTDPLVHQWIIWAIIVLVSLIFIGLFLFAIDFANEPVVIVEPVKVVV